MSRTTKWKLEKAKIKVVFRLQFHATHIPQSGWEKLFISFISTESGKIIAKTSKANVRNGTCKWADPIYETTRLLLDSRNQQYDDKFYKLIVGMGTSLSSILGEATINLADYADASSPSVIALPLHGSDYGTILHVTVQLLSAKTGFREFEQQHDRGLQSSSNLNREEESGIVTILSSKLDDHGNKVNAKIQLRAESKELTSVVEETGMHEEFLDSPIGCDGSSNASESSYADKHDSSSTHELDSHRSTVSGELNGPAHNQSQPREKADQSDHQQCGSDYSMDNDLAIADKENHRHRRSLEMAESSISELKQELSALHNHANEMGTETRKIAQQLMAEISSGQELEREIIVLRSQCSKFKDDLEQLKEIKTSSKFTERTLDVNERHQFTWVAGLLLVEDRIRELQEKIHTGFRESDSSFVHSDLEVLLGIVLDIQKATVEALPLQHEVQEPGSTRAFGLPEGKGLELLSLMDEAKNERENLVRKMDEMECYYETLVQELEENQKQVLENFQSFRNEHLACANTISTCKADTESIRHDMNKQILKFSEERHALVSVNEELEKRVINAESALKRARMNYSIAVSQLQKDLDMLSYQVLSMFETNQNLIKETFSESSKPLCQGYPHIVENLPKDETIVLREKQLLGGDVLSDDELCEMCCANLYLDVYSGFLEETLFEAGSNASKMKEQINEYAQKLELSNRSRDFLLGRLQTAVEDVHPLSEQIAKINDMQLQKQKLEENLGNVSRENFLLMEKIIECEALLMDYRVYKSKYEVASAENLELKNVLEVQVLDNGNLQNNLSFVKEELETLKVGFQELEMSKENMQKVLDFLQEKLGSSLTFCEEQFGRKFSNSLCRDMDLGDIASVIMKLEEVHNYTGKKIKDLEKERDIARSEIDDMTTKFKHDISYMVTRLDTLNATVEKLQLQLESVANKFKNTMELEESHVQHTEGILKYLASLELELQNISTKETNFLQVILGLGAVTDEFERTRLTVSEFNQAKQDFLMSIENNRVDIIICQELESEIILIVLKAKVEEHYDELIMLQDKCSELTDKLSEQNLKTTEYKNLAKEFKHSADAVRGKRELEGPSESLRIAFMKEQYETMVQELKEQLSVSKRHGEDLLFKLQDALDETESRKKSEASHFKRIQESSFKIVELEAELQSIQAELECALLNIECCKEEKEKILASMQECEEEKSKVAVELSLIREQLAQKEESSIVDKASHVEIDGLMKVDASAAPIVEAGYMAQMIEVVSDSEGVGRILEDASAGNDNLMQNNSKQLTVIDDQIRAQNLRCCMDQLGEKLESMKNENSLLPLTNFDSSFQDLHRELVQLHKACQELRRIYPNFDDCPGDGMALERVLALEIELAETLTAKKKSSIQLQSSILKQHSDEGAVFKSFRDINELIKDTLDTKSKYINVETELKKMHERYSHLTLQFAEVEGERQKLRMTVKNMRSSRNLVHMNCSSSESPNDSLL